MRVNIGAALVVLALAGGISQQAWGEERWAAIAPNSEGASRVVWGDSENDARQRALEACMKVSKTCADTPALTDNMNDVFALMCCKRPRLACAVGTEATRPRALRAVREVFNKSGFRSCTLRDFLSAGTGLPQ